MRCLSRFPDYISYEMRGFWSVKLWSQKLYVNWNKSFCIQTRIIQTFETPCNWGSHWWFKDSIADVAAAVSNKMGVFSARLPDEEIIFSAEVKAIEIAF